MIIITDNETFDYSTIKNVYKNNKSAYGIQVNNLKEKEDLLEMCDKIADIIFETQDKLNKK
jgi:hypothetical protein